LSRVGWYADQPFWRFFINSFGSQAYAGLLKAVLRQSFSTFVYCKWMRFQTLVWANQRNYFEIATAYIKHMLKTTVATQLNSLLVVELAVLPDLKWLFLNGWLKWPFKIEFTLIWKIVTFRWNCREIQNWESLKNNNILKSFFTLIHLIMFVVKH